MNYYFDTTDRPWEGLNVRSIYDAVDINGDDIVFVHKTDLEYNFTNCPVNFKSVFENEEAPKPSLVFYSGDGMADNYNLEGYPPQMIKCCPMPITRDCTEENLHALLDFATGGDLMTNRAEFILAFRLLCAAKQECGKEASREKAFGTDLRIHAPEKLPDWLGPFDASDIDQAAQIIGASLFTGEVSKVLQAVGKDWGELSSAIDEFEAAFAKR